MVACAVEQRNRARAALEAAAAHPRVVGSDLLTPTVALTNRWVVELTVSTDHCPPEVARTLGEHGLGIRDVSPITPDHVRVLAEVRR